mmetsp:Transcript_9361/g.15129  ORF Transcript_9361/g.15129 Transcript_9361/m.15129 type:complete len:85 (+) Transcript_9361:213-467(+)
MAAKDPQMDDHRCTWWLGCIDWIYKNFVLIAAIAPARACLAFTNSSSSSSSSSSRSSRISSIVSVMSSTRTFEKENENPCMRRL